MEKFEKNVPGESRGPAGGDKKGKRLEPYIPIEEIPNPVNLEKELEEETLEEDDDKETDLQKQERIHNELISQTINFQQSEGVAHAGPGVEQINQFSEGVEVQDKEKNKNRGDKKIGEFLPSFSSIGEDLDRIVSHGAGVFRKALRNTGEEHDNLKTLKKNKSKGGMIKMEKAERGGIRDVLHSTELQQEPEAWELPELEKDPRDDFNSSDFSKN